MSVYSLPCGVIVGNCGSAIVTLHELTCGMPYGEDGFFWFLSVPSVVLLALGKG